MERIPINFEQKGKQYTGELMPVSGVGHPNSWYLLIENRYMVNLCYTDRWIFHSEKMPEIADLLGDYVVAWYE